MAWLVKHLLCEYKDLSLNSTNTCRKLGMVGYACNSSDWKWRLGGLPGLTAQPMHPSEIQAKERLCLKEVDIVY